MIRFAAFRLHLTALAAAVPLVACRPGTKATPADETTTLTGESASLDDLITSAGDDFRAHAGGLIQVRSIRFALRDTMAGDKHYVLCGEFRRRTDGDTAQWVPFATVQTSKYEQWLGDTRFCQDVLSPWNTADSLTSLLQKRLD